MGRLFADAEDPLVGYGMARATGTPATGWAIPVVATLAVGLGLIPPIACVDTIAEVAATRGVGGASSSLASATGGSAGQGAGSTGEIATCGNKIYQCGDLLDNDADGLIDAADPDCLGPCDNTEDSYYGGIPGQNQSPCRMDCYFDNDSGHGTDDCFWSHKCDPHEVPPYYYPKPDKGNACAYDADASIPGTSSSCEELQSKQSETCLEVCLPLTPNGCDCFGCCELPQGSGKFVYLGSVGADGSTVCTASAIDDPTVCHPCLPVSACFNGCDPCEYCLGKTELPPHCDDPGEQCDGWQPCGGPEQAPCPSKTYCITGCCVPIPQ
jgi:hypothetical protein